MWGVDCYVHWRQQQRGAGAEFHSYARKGNLAGYDGSSPSSHGWVTQEGTLGSILRVTFGQENRTLDLFGETKAPDLSQEEECVYIEAIKSDYDPDENPT